MAEEKKDAGKAEKEQPKQEKATRDEVKKPAEQPKEGGQPAKKVPEQKPAKQTSEKSKKALPTNCVMCNKAFKHKKWYYKNGGYFCTKRCWKKFAEEKAKEKAEKAAKESEAKEAAAKAAQEKATQEKAAQEKASGEQPDSSAGADKANPPSE